MLAGCRSTYQLVGIGEACDNDDRRCDNSATCQQAVCVAPPDAAPLPPVRRAADPSGCSDGRRDGLYNRELYPGMAACSGGWTVAGIVTALSYQRQDACMGPAGNDKSGHGCSAADLCAQGWHVCENVDEVRAYAAGTAANVCIDAVSDLPGMPRNELFFATRQPGYDQQSEEGTICTLPPANAITVERSNNVFGCGSTDTGSPATHPSCQPFRMLAARPNGPQDCALYAPWNCGTDATHESEYVTKFGPRRGGVLCCIDADAYPDAAAAAKP